MYPCSQCSRPLASSGCCDDCAIFMQQYNDLMQQQLPGAPVRLSPYIPMQATGPVMLPAQQPMYGQYAAGGHPGYHSYGNAMQQTPQQPALYYGPIINSQRVGYPQHDTPVMQYHAPQHLANHQQQAAGQNNYASEFDENLEKMLKDPIAEIKPKALRKGCSSITETQWQAHGMRLSKILDSLRERLQRMDEVQYHGPDRVIACQTIQRAEAWYTSLELLRRRRRNSTQLADQHGTLITKKVKGQAYFEIGVIDQDWRLCDIRKKRFINCGVKCNRCKDGENDHPQLLGCELYEVFSFYVGPKIYGKKKRCTICTKQFFHRKASHHHDEQHGLGMWYDHPGNERQDLGQYEGWKHCYPSRVLPGWKPGPVNKVYEVMKAAEKRRQRSERKRL